MVGAQTASGFTVAARTAATSVRLGVSTTVGFTSPTWFGPVAPAAGVAKIAATGLAANTPYWWRVEEDSTVDTTNTGQCRTFPTPGTAHTFTIAAASCAGIGATNPGPAADTSDSPVFDSIRTAAPLFFAHLGDMHYRDIGVNDPDLYRTAIDDVMACQRQHDLYRNVPIVYTWDDHDYGANNSNASSPSRAAACQVYRERFPHHTLPDGAGGGIWRSFVVGRTLVIVSDCRSYRATGTMLGTAQKAWITSTLTANATCKALIWVQSVPWIIVPEQANSQDTWAQYVDERDELYETVFAGWLDRMVTVHGDNHAMSMDSGSHNQWGGFPVYMFAALDCSQIHRGGPYTYGPVLGGNHWGTVTITDNGGDDVTVTGTGYVGSSVWAQHTSWGPPSETPIAPGVRRVRVG